LLGAGGAWGLFHHLDIQKLTQGMFLMFEVTPKMMGFAFSVAALLGLLAAILPMINVARTTVVQGLKTLD
jgi:ABC-type antimicrobial peptide transport system permease subunit